MPASALSIVPAASEREPWRACYRDLAPKLLLFARQWLPSAADAEDVVQTAFIRFWQKQPGATPEHYPLLFAAVRTAAIDCLRGNARRLKREHAFYDGGPGENRPWFEPSLEERERTDLLQAALRELPEEQRETLVLHIWGELTFAQIAEILSLSINTVSARYRYALQALRRSYNPSTYERF